MDEESLAELMFATTLGIGVKTLHKLQAVAKKNQLSLVELWRKSALESYQKLLRQAGILTIPQCREITLLQQKFSPQGYVEYVHERGSEITRLDTLIDANFIYDNLLPPYVLTKRSTSQVLPAGILDGFQRPPRIGFVGTRAMTSYGEYATHYLTRELTTQLGAVTVSGCMVGIDTVAHQTALASGGTSIGVVGFGFDHCYPRRYQQVLDGWVEQGLVLLSEYPPWISPTKGTFVQRNRLIAALSETTIVVEAPLKSGALITAQFANDYGKPVGAVPGQLGASQSAGAHNLIKQGAYLVSSAQDIVDELPSQYLQALAASAKAAKEIPLDWLQVLNKLATQPSSFDVLFELLAQPAELLRKNLLELEMAQLLQQKAGRWQLTAQGYEYLHRPVQ